MIPPESDCSGEPKCKLDSDCEEDGFICCDGCCVPPVPSMYVALANVWPDIHSSFMQV